MVRSRFWRVATIGAAVFFMGQLLVLVAATAAFRGDDSDRAVPLVAYGIAAAASILVAALARGLLGGVRRHPLTLAAVGTTGMWVLSSLSAIVVLQGS
ncbi:hypothetical protein ACWDSJ_08350 [Nocardia sp. NPDC003482]